MANARPVYQSDRSYNTTVMELKRRARSKDPVFTSYSAIRGTRDTTCTLGLCCSKIEAMQDGTFARYAAHPCPHDSRYYAVDGTHLPIDDHGHARHLNGCFYTCRIFSDDESVDQIRARVQKVVLIPEVTPASDVDIDVDCLMSEVAHDLLSPI